MKKSPKILQVIPELHTGGAERTTIDIGNELVARAWSSIVASAGGRMVEELRSGGTTHIELPLNSKNPYTILRNSQRLKQIIEDAGVDLIHARSRAPAWSAFIAARRTGIPFVTTYHGAYNEKSRIKGLYNSVMARADAVIANSQWTADLIASRNPWAREKITVIHRGTDFDAFKSASISTERLSALQKLWGLTKDDLVVLHLARMTGWKGQSIVIKAAEKIAPQFPKLKFILAGDAQGRQDYLDGLQQQIEAANLEGIVRLPGHCNDPAAAMALADIVVVASTEAEAFGRAAVEAGALEKPVIVTRIGAVGETVLAEPEVSESKRTGWKVEPGNADEMANSLRHCLALDSDARHAIGQRARQHGSTHFSLQAMCDKTIKIYEKLLRPNE